MKSWTALKLVYCVQNGLNFLDHQTVQGDAIYFGLEDSKRRIKDRVNKLKNGFSQIKTPTNCFGW